MKKTLALILSLLLAFSCFTVCMATPVSAATTGTNLLADYTVHNWTFAADRPIAERTTENPETHKGGYCFGARSVGSRGFYTTFPVTANEEYTLSFSVKSMYIYQYLKLGVASEFTYQSSDNKLADQTKGTNVIDLATLNANNYTANGVFKDDGQWTEVSYTFTPTESTDYSLVFAFLGLAGSTSTDTNINPYYFAISDLTLVGPEEESTDNTNLFADKTVSDWLSDPADNRVLNNAATTTVSRYGGYAFMSTSVHWQGLRLPFSVKANTSYVLSFSAKSSANWEGVAVFDATGLSFGNGKNPTINYLFDTAAVNALNTNAYTSTVEGVANLEGVSDAKWTDITIEFTPTADSANYVLYLAWNSSSSGYNDVIISDLCLKAYGNVPTSVEGNGKVNTEPSVAYFGDAVTYTATAYPGETFLGWYVNGEQVSTETTYNGLVGIDVPTAKFTANNPLASKTVSDWLSDPADNRVLNNAAITTVSRYGGYAFMSTSVHWQGLRLPFSVKANASYVLSFSAKSSANWEGVAVFDATGLSFGNGKNSTINYLFDTSAVSALNANAYTSTVEGVANLEGVSEAEWTDITLEFTPTADSANYVLYLAWNNSSSGYNDVIISDLKLSVKEVVPTSVVGNGAVKASPTTAASGESVTYTATAYQDSEFLGWYDGETLVSTETIYEGKAFEEEPLTAKFTGTNLLADTNYQSWSVGTTAMTIEDATATSRYGGTNSISPRSSWRGMHLTMAVEQGKEYTLSFNYYLPTYPDTTVDQNLVRIATFVGTDVIYNDDGQQSNGTWLATKELNSPLDAWGEHTYTFTAPANSVDWAIGTGWNAGIIISDISLTTEESVNVTANVTGNGAVKAEPATVLIGEGATLTATAYQNDRFIGWYDGNALVSTAKTYTVDAVYEKLDITAKFTGINILADMTADAWYDNTTSGYEGVEIVVDDATTESLNGGTAIKFTSGSAWRGTHLDLPALAAGTYKLQLNVYHPAGSTLSHISVVGDAIYSVPATHSDPSGQQANVYGGWQNLCSSVATTDAGWVTYSKVITIDDGKDYDLYIDCAGGCNGTIFSDFSLVEFAEEADSLHTAHNNMLAIRGANSSEGIASGTRVYNQISKEWIAKKGIVEFGVLAIRTERLNGGDLTLNTPGVATSVAWTSKGDASSFKLWAETDTTYEFTAVLINVAPKHFDDTYTMTTYAKDANGNVYYGDNQELSMYQAIYAVLSAEPENEIALELAAYGTERGDTTYEDWKTAWEVE